MASEQSLRKTQNIMVWVWQVALALLFLMVGGSKLAGVKQHVQLFQQIGIGQWFRYLTGVLEIAGAVALVIPRTAVFGALLLGGIMAAAALVQLFVVHGSAIAPVMLLAANGLVAWVKLRGPAPGISKSQAA
jgi:putative oxidoreductase